MAIKCLCSCSISGIKLIYPERASRPLQSFNRSSINFLCPIFYHFRHQTLSDNFYRHFPQYTCLRICAKLRLFYTLLAKYNSCTQSIDAEPKQICYMRASFLFTCNQFRIRKLFNPVAECMPLIKFMIATGPIHVGQNLIV